MHIFGVTVHTKAVTEGTLPNLATLIKGELSVYCTNK